MQTQEIYHAVKSFILDKTNGPTVINVPYVDFHLYTLYNFYYYISFFYTPTPQINNENIIVTQKLKTKKNYPFHGTRNSFLSQCASQ